MSKVTSLVRAWASSTPAQCARCHITRYCSTDCQRKDWDFTNSPALSLPKGLQQRLSYVGLSFSGLVEVFLFFFQSLVCAVTLYIRSYILTLVRSSHKTVKFTNFLDSKCRTFIDIIDILPHYVGAPSGWRKIHTGRRR